MSFQWLQWLSLTYSHSNKGQSVILKVNRKRYSSMQLHWVTWRVLCFNLIMIINIDAFFKRIHCRQHLQNAATSWRESHSVSQPNIIFVGEAKVAFQNVCNVTHSYYHFQYVLTTKTDTIRPTEQSLNNHYSNFSNEQNDKCVSLHCAQSGKNAWIKKQQSPFLTYSEQCRPPTHSVTAARFVHAEHWCLNPRS